MGGRRNADSVSCRLLPGHGDAEAFLGLDEVVVIVGADVELHPVDLPGEPTVSGRVVGCDGGARLLTDVSRLVGGEDHGMRGLHTAGADSRAVVEEGDVAALGQSAAVVGELHAHLVGTGRNGVSAAVGYSWMPSVL